MVSVLSAAFFGILISLPHQTEKRHSIRPNSRNYSTRRSFLLSRLFKLSDMLYFLPASIVMDISLEKTDWCCRGIVLDVHVYSQNPVVRILFMRPPHSSGPRTLL